MRFADNQQLENFLRQNAYSDSQPDFAKVWKKVQLTGGKEVKMSEKKGGFKVIAWLMSFMVIAALGWFGLTKFSTIQKMEKIDKGENIVVTLVVGEVEVMKAGTTEWRPLFVEDVVAMGDSVKTGQDSYCEIQMIGRGVFRLEDETELQLAHLVNVDGNVQSTMKLAKGEIGLKPKKLKQGEIFEVETETAVAAVRGTKFSVKSDGSGNTKIAVAEGKVDVTPNIQAFKNAEEKGLVDKQAAEILKQQMIQPISVSANEELAMDSKQVEMMDQAIETGIEEVAKVEGPITAQKMGVEPEKTDTTDVAQSEDKQENKTVVAVPKLELANKIMVQAEKDMKVQAKANGVKEIAMSNPQDLAQSMSVKQEISAESKKKLESLTEDKIITKADQIVKLVINSDPMGAKVTIDGKLAGVTPLDKVYSQGKELDIRIEMDGFDSYSQKVSLNRPDMNISPRLKSLEDKTAKADEKTDEVKQDEQKTDEVKADEQKTEVVEAPKPVSGDFEWKKNLAFVEDVENPVVYRGKVYATKGNTLFILNMNGQVEKKIEVVSADAKLTRPVTGYGNVYVGSSSGGMYVYDVNGNLSWKNTSVGKQMFGASPAVAKNKVAVPSLGNGIQVFSTDGALLNTVSVSSSVYSSPYLGNDGKLLVYGTDSKQLVGYDLENNKELWRKSVGDRVLFPLYGSDKVVIVILRNSGEVIGFDPVTGEQKWSKTISGLAGTKINPDYINGMLVLVTAARDKVVVLWNENGGTVTSKNVEGISSAPYLSGNWLYIGTSSGKVLGYNYNNGKSFSYSTGEKVSVLAADDKGVFAVTKSKMTKLVK